MADVIVETAARNPKVEYLVRSDLGTIFGYTGVFH